MRQFNQLEKTNQKRKGRGYYVKQKRKPTRVIRRRFYL